MSSVDYCHDCRNHAWMFRVGAVRVCTDCYDRRLDVLKKEEASRLVTPAHKITIDEFLATGLRVEVGFLGDTEPIQALLLDYSHLGILIARLPTDIAFYPWSAIRRVTEAR